MLQKKHYTPARKGYKKNNMNIRKRGKSYQFRVSAGYENGKQVIKTMSFTPPPGLTQRQEERAVTEAYYNFERRVTGGASVKYDKMRFDEFVSALYLKNHAATLKPKTRRQYEIIIDTRLIPYFGKMYLKDITPLDVRGWLASLERSDGSDGKLSENSKGVWFRTLSAILGKAEEWELIEANPCKKVKAPRKPQSDVKALQMSDFVKVFEKLPEYEDIRIKTLVAVLLYTGIREAEAAGLEWKDFNTFNNSVSIRRTVAYVPGLGLVEDTPKSAASVRTIFYPPELAEILEDYRRWQASEIEARGSLWTGARGESAKLFTQYNGAPIFDTTLRKWTKKFMTWAGVPYVTVHGLRHTFASVLIANGIDARTTAAQLGHNSPALVYNVYANKQTAAQVHAAEVLGAISKNKGQIKDKKPKTTPEAGESQAK
ncbi:MAG: site-specific integrase [Eubacteriales bacterium]|nr:site-specific integrase [Eubacteriales bacterium]